MDVNLAPFPRGLDENLRRDVEFLVQITNHVQRQRPLSSHDLIYTRSLADDPDQCARVFAFLFQSELDRFDRIGEFYRIAFALICLYQGCQNVQLVAFCRTCGGIPQLLHPAQCPLVIGFPSKRALLSLAALKICLRDKPAF